MFTTLAAKAADLTPEDNNFVAPNCIKLQDPGKTQDVGGFGNVKITGVNGIKRNGDEGFSTTGIFVRKYMNYKADPATRQLHQSTQSWKVFRYLETGNNALKAEAFEHVNEIRDRAGAHRHEMVASPADIGEELYGFPLDENLQYIRDERRRELCIENQGEWDQRRWRTAHSILASNYWPRTLMPYDAVQGPQRGQVHLPQRSGGLWPPPVLRQAQLLRGHPGRRDQQESEARAQRRLLI